MSKKYEFVCVKDVATQVTTCFDLPVYTVEDAYISLFGDYSLMHKLDNGKMFYFNESFNYPQNRVQINYEKPLKLSTSILLEEGCCLAAFWGHNYWHFTFECLSKLLLLETQGYSGVYIIPSDLGFITQILAILKIRSERIIKFVPNTIYFVKKMHVVSSISGGVFLDNLPLVGLIREKILDNIQDEAVYPEKIFVRRIGRRKPINEDKIIDFLKEKGFEILIPEELSVEQQVKYFHNAKICVTPHGANSTNVLYMKPHTTFVELFGKNYVNPCMFSAINLLNINYHIVAENLEINSASCAEDYYVNMELLKTIVDGSDCE